MSADPIILAGPTASGKSATALELAEQIGGEIVCGDAFQLYEGIAVLTASPTAEERRRVPHHLFGVLPLHVNGDAALFARFAVETIADIAGRGAVPVVVGGSGLYLEALAFGLSALPDVPEEIRQRVGCMIREEQLAALARLDPIAHRRVDLQNPRRVSRALEVCLAAGRPYSDFRADWNPDATRPLPLHGWRFRIFVLTMETEALGHRIDERVDALIAGGAVEEVRRAQTPGETAIKAIGFRQIQDALSGAISMDEAAECTKRATRQYAKRQRIWFRSRAQDALVEAGPDAAARIAGHYGLRK